jgi:anti-sigma factor RsiW
MDCKFTENISLLMDGELSPEQAQEVQLHLSACAICQQAQEDFHLLRQEIQSYQSEFDISAQRRNLHKLLDEASLLKSERLPFWRRRIALPVPALAFIALLFVALSLWAVSLRAAKPSQSPESLSIQRVRPAVNPFDVSRFDKGGRAVIYTARRTSTNEQPQKEVNKSKRP